MIKRFSSRPHITTNTMSDDIKIIRPVLERHGRAYLAKLNLGTFPGHQPPTYYFDFDTGSDLTWLQCEDCTKPGNKCFRQVDPPYLNSRSTSYSPLIYGRSPLCYSDKHIGQYCTYQVLYGEGSYSNGFLAYETFTFGSSDSPRIVIGCSVNNMLTSSDPIAKEAGILGMSLGGVPIQEYRNDPLYYVNLQGISINNQRLAIPPQAFARISHQRGGCIIDSGTAYTYLPVAA
ncbi:hypothetical protein QQ045_030660 [Rhodiola kirilowii]